MSYFASIQSLASLYLGEIQAERRIQELGRVVVNIDDCNLNKCRSRVDAITCDDLSEGESTNKRKQARQN